MTLTEYVLARAAGRGDTPALVDAAGTDTVTYADLARAVPVAAGRLAAAGIAPGDTVALVAPNRPSWAVALHGALAAGAAVAPLSPLGTVDELARQLRAAHAVAVVADGGVEQRVRLAAASTGVDVVIVLADLAAPGDGGGLPPALPPPVDPDSVAVMPFSSGTTGLPKAVRLTHRNLVANLEQHRVVQHLGPGDVLCAVIPFTHSYGLTLVLHTALAAGATVVTMPRFEPAAYLDAVATHGVTRLFVAPPVLRILDELASGGPLPRLASVHVAVCGAAPLDRSLAARVAERYGFPVVQGYGMTEASPGTHFTPDDRWESVPAGSVGWLVPGTEARIEPVAGADGAGRAGTDGVPGAEGAGGAGTDGVPGADGVVQGELWVRGPQVMAGYLDAPAATAATVDPDGWLRTGDVVQVDPQGCFYVIDRVKELIKYKGHQVAPAELESLVLGHPAVRDVAVVGVPDPVAGELPKAFVVPDGELDHAELLAWVAERVAPYKRLRLVEQVEAIPRSPAGKVLRRMLRDA